MCKGRDFPTASSQDIYELLSRMALNGEPGILATVVKADGQGPGGVGGKMVIHEEGRTSGTVGGGVAEAKVISIAGELIKSGGCRLITIEPGTDGCGGRREIFLESLQQGTPFWILGAGHVGRALVELGRKLPFRFTVVDKRVDELLNLEQEFGVNTLVAGPDMLQEALATTPSAAVLIASPDHELDFEYLQIVLAVEKKLGVEFSYFGLLGSERKVNKFRQRLTGESAFLARLDHAQMPVGLDLGSTSPHGIALSILAETVAVLNQRPCLHDENGIPVGLRFHRKRQG